MNHDPRINHLKSRGNLKVSSKTITNVNDVKAITTKFYGPIWFSLFCMIMGQYPVKVNWTNQSHLQIVNSFKSMLIGLKHTLPCRFCRESFSTFQQELDLNRFLDSRVNVLLWLYLMKDKVNVKLIQQEADYLLKINTQLNRGEISSTQYKKQRKICFVTKPTPKFEEILKYYSQYSAECSKTIKKCVSKTDLNF